MVEKLSDSLTEQESYKTLCNRGMLWGTCATFVGFALLYFLGSISSDASHGIIRALGLFAWLLMVIGIIVVLIAGVSWIYQAITKSDQKSES
jgi:hypothetical protein